MKHNHIEYSWDELSEDQKQLARDWWPPVNRGIANEHRYRFNNDGSIRDATK